MARKRGGLAGIWDKKKNIITPVATGLVGAFGSPIAAAALGAAMRGLDRPGKAGIGIDPFAAMKGGVEGYAAGKLGKSAKKGVASFFAPKAAAPAISQFATPQVGQGFFPGGIGGSAMANPFAAPAAAADILPVTTPSLPNVNMPGKIGAMLAPNAGPSPVTTVPRGLAAGGGANVAGNVSDGKKPGRISQLLSGVRENWEPISGIAEAIGGTMTGQQANALKQQENDLLQMRMQMEQEKFRTDQESRRRLTQLLMPLLQAQMTNVLPPNPVVSR